MHAPTGSAELRYAAFTDDPAGGNPAGVVLGAALPSDGEMQATAARIGFSETAFVAPRRDTPDLDIRYFSPEREVAFCGHATIASAVALGERDNHLDSVRFVTRDQTVPVAIRRSDGPVEAVLTSPPTSSRPVPADVLDAALATFGWTRDAVSSSAPSPAIAFAGATHLILPVAEERTLRAMRYDYDALRDLMLAHGWTTVAVVWRDAPDRFHARNPFPVGGVVEDPATGAAAAALGGLLRDVAAVPVPSEITVLQGHDLGRPSVLHVEIPADEPGIRVRGTAVRMP